MTKLGRAEVRSTRVHLDWRVLKPENSCILYPYFELFGFKNHFWARKRITLTHKSVIPILVWYFDFEEMQNKKKRYNLADTDWWIHFQISFGWLHLQIYPHIDLIFWDWGSISKKLGFSFKLIFRNLLSEVLKSIERSKWAKLNWITDEKLSVGRHRIMGDNW